MGMEKFQRMVASPGGVRFRDTRITVAQMVALFTTEITLVPAPKSGFANVFEGAVIFKNAGTAYTIGTATNLSIAYTNKSGLVVSEPLAPATFFDATGAKVTLLRPAAVSGTAGLAIVNGVLCLFQATANMTGGTSATVRIRTFYKVVPLTL